MAKYQNWIMENVPDYQAAYGKCKAVTSAMNKQFPELTRVSGFYHCSIWGRRQHFWLRTDQGEIIDPTAKQFPSGGMGKYEEIIDSKLIPTGVCPNCGQETYEERYFCSESCNMSYATYIMGSK